MQEKIKILTEESFEQNVQHGTLLIDFYADWCGPCRMMTPILENVAHQMHGSATIAKIDIDHAQKIASTYQVTSIPTLILLKEGKELGRLVGLCDEKAVIRFIQSSIA